MKLMIFGDSFGEEFAHGFSQGKPYHAEHYTLNSYHRILRESKLFSSIENYAFSGCDLWHQYKLFLKHYTGHEKVIWFLTNPNRITIDNPDKSSKFPFTITGLNFSEFQLDMIKSGQLADPTKSAEKIYAAAVDYYKYLVRDDYDEYVYRSLIADIQAKAGENVWMIPCFTIEPYKQSLSDVFLMESIGLGYDVQKYQSTCIDIRRNHLTEENHKILAIQILQYFQTGKELDFSLFVKPSRTDFTKYIKPRNYKPK